MTNLSTQSICEKDIHYIPNCIILNLFKHKFSQKRKPVQWFIKKSLDIIISLIGLILISPLLLLIAIVIRVDSKGPIIYKQRRVGLAGKLFYMYKFRSMKIGAENEEDSVKKAFNQENVIMFKIKDDPRITSVGKFLRKFSLDELPQLYNVLIGDMSLVGPRPRVEKDLEFFKDWHYVFFSAMPGITGMWQTNGRSAVKDFDKVIALEYHYIKTWNILLDFIILLKTLPVVILGINAS